MVNKQTLNNLKQWFSNYVQTFASKNSDMQQNITLKEEHTNRVCEEIVHLGHQLGLNDGELRLAELTALFHDIGRFEQYAMYGTFMDRKSVNHAELGVKILQEKGVLSCLDHSAQDLVFRIIGYHNRAFLPVEESVTCLFFSKLLRDADKLDIWRVVTDYYRQDNISNTAIELDLPDTPFVSDAVVADIRAEKIVDMRHLKNVNDLKLLQLGWVYDLNFIPTFQRLSEKGYLNMIRAVLPKTNDVENVFESINTFLIRKCAEESSFVDGLNGC